MGVGKNLLYSYSFRLSCPAVFLFSVKVWRSTRQKTPKREQSIFYDGGDPFEKIIS